MLEITNKISESKAIKVLTTAFISDPISRWLYPDVQKFLQCYPIFASAFAKTSIQTENAYMIGDYLSVSAWVAPGQNIDENAIIDSIESTVQCEQKKGEVYELFEKMEKFHPLEPVWYLPLIGTDPIHSDKGIGTKLMLAQIAKADAQNIPTYLESTNLKNLPFYERLGYKKLGSLKSVSSPEIFPMIREPNIK